MATLITKNGTISRIELPIDQQARDQLIQLTIDGDQVCSSLFRDAHKRQVIVLHKGLFLEGEANSTAETVCGFKGISGNAIILNPDETQEEMERPWPVS